MKKLNKSTYAALFDPTTLKKSFKEAAPDVWQWRKEQKKIAKARKRSAAALAAERSGDMK